MEEARREPRWGMWRGGGARLRAGCLGLGGSAPAPAAGGCPRCPGTLAGSWAMLPPPPKSNPGWGPLLPWVVVCSKLISP